MDNYDRFDMNMYTEGQVGRTDEESKSTYRLWTACPYEKLNYPT